MIAGEVDDELQSMILEMSALEQKWLIRILLKDLHLGLSRGKILYLFHPDANDFFDVNSNIEKVSMYVILMKHILLFIIICQKNEILLRI